MFRKVPFILLVVVIMVMVTATFVEKWTGTAVGIYGSWWFAFLWAVLAVCSVVLIFRQQMQRRPVLLLLHLSFAVILAGSLVTRIWGEQDVVQLRQGVENRDYPFPVELQTFEVLNYPGTPTPMDYVSVVRVGSDTLRISMNRIGEYKGYRFYQTGYDPDLAGTVLTVSHDPWGIGITYAGYALLFLSMFLLLVLPDEGFRRALRKLTVWLALALFAFPADTLAAPQVLPDTLASQFCDLHVYYNGRICPLQTVARDFTVKLYGKPSYQGYSAEQVFSGWVLFPTQWQKEPLKPARKAVQATEQEAVVQMMLNGQFLKIYPYKGRWYGLGDYIPSEMGEEDWFFVKKSMDYVTELAVRKDYDRLGYTLRKIARYQETHAEALPSAAAHRAEKLYNTCKYTRPLAMLFAALGILLFGVYLRFWIKGTQLPRALRVANSAVLLLTCGYLTVFNGLRWFVSGHLPLSNGHETMMFLAWLTLMLTLLLQHRFVLVVPFGYLLTGLTLLVSMMGQANPPITPLMPVLASPLLSVHVCIIMLAYSLLGFTFLNGLTGLFLSDAAKVVQLRNISHALLFPALFSLSAGIFIGAIWANMSWGRYWGWDPKEVWALITLLVYCFALHGRSLSWFRNPRHFHLFMVLAFLTVLMTYFGVNFLLGGMHSYANS